MSDPVKLFELKPDATLDAYERQLRQLAREVAERVMRAHGPIEDLHPRLRADKVAQMQRDVSVALEPIVRELTRLEMMKPVRVIVVAPIGGSMGDCGRPTLTAKTRRNTPD